MFASPAPALADPAQDEIVLHLTAERPVPTETGRVTVQVDLTLSAVEAEKARPRIDATLGELSAGAWRIQRLGRTRDSSGQERISATGEARLPEAVLAGLAGRADTLSRPDRRILVVGVDTAPSLADSEAAAAALRREIYMSAKAEIARVAEAWPERRFRVHRLDFEEPPRPALPLNAPPLPEGVRARGFSIPGAESAPGAVPMPTAASAPISDRMVLKATLVLAAPPPGSP